MDNKIPNDSKKSLKRSVSLSINIPRALLWFSCMLELILISVLGIACATNFTCSEFLPGPGYLGSTQGYSKLLIIFCTFYSFILLFFYTLCYINFRLRLSELKKNVFIYVSIVSTISLPMIGLTNESIDIYTIPVPKLYNFSSSSFVISTFIATLMVYDELNRFKVTLKDNEKLYLVVLKAMVWTIRFLFGFCLLQWTLGYGSYKGMIFNQNLQSASEWGIFFVAAMLPFVFSKFFRDYNLDLLPSVTKKVLASGENLV